MTKTRLFTGIIGALLLVGPTAVYASQHAKSTMHKPDFSTIDKDGNGLATLEEIQAYHATMQAENFREMDKNSDGRLDKDELATMGHGLGHSQKGDKKHKGMKPQEHAAKMLEKMDTDKDGMISTDEMASYHNVTKMLEKHDTDKDGAISASEFEDAHVGKYHDSDK